MTLPPVDGDRWRRVQELFLACLDRPADHMDILRTESDPELRASP